MHESIVSAKVVYPPLALDTRFGERDTRTAGLILLTAPGRSHK